MVGVGSYTNASVELLQELCQADAACVGFTTGTGVSLPVGTGVLKNASCIAGLFSSAAPTLHLLQTHSATDIGWPPVWPRPVSFSNGSDANHIAFQSMQIVPNATTVPKRMQLQFQRFLSRHFGDWPLVDPTQQAHYHQEENHGIAASATLEVHVGDPQKLFDCDESYSLAVPHGDDLATKTLPAIVLTAATAAGVNWGLETLSQLMHLDRNSLRSISGGSKGPWIVIRNTPITVQDKPRFRYRGFFVDGARHFLSLSILRRVVEALSATKLNKLHW